MSQISQKVHISCKGLEMLLKLTRSFKSFLLNVSKPFKAFKMSQMYQKVLKCFKSISRSVPKCSRVFEESQMSQNIFKCFKWYEVFQEVYLKSVKMFSSILNVSKYFNLFKMF